jgi:HK97 family phage prohead protease
MPYPNEHACRLREPGDFQEDSFRRVERKHEGKPYAVIMGKLKGESAMTEQAYRYPTAEWSAAEAREHCEAHDGTEFSPAEEKKSQPLIIGDSGVERRFIASEVRVVEQDGVPHIRGYGAVFNEWSMDLGGFREMVEPGAFTKTLQEADVRALFNHDPNRVLGRSQAGTLRVFEDEHGLGYDAIPPDTQWARDLLTSIKRGDIDGSSFGFRAVRDTWSKDGDGNPTRRLREVELFDVGPVTFPAYTQTSAEARSKVEEMRQATDAPGQEAHPSGGDEDGVQVHLDTLRRRLDLASVE